MDDYPDDKDQLIERIKSLENKVDSFYKKQDDYETIFQHLPFWVLTFDRMGRLIEANAEVQKSTGLNVENYTGKTFMDLGVLPKKDILKATVEFAKNLQGRVTNKTVYCITFQNDKTCYLEVIGIPLKEKGKVIRVLVVGTDITERKKAEEDLQRNLKELKQFKEAAVGRENRMIELKKEVNVLCEKLDKKPRYDMSFFDDADFTF